MEVLVLLLVLVISAAGKEHYEDIAAHQLSNYAESVGQPKILTTANGSPVEFLDANWSVNRRLLFNEMLMETLTHLNRQKIPERLSHAKGAGASGYFEVTHDISNICKAKFLNQIGKKTPIRVRFSPIVGNKGGADTIRDIRGFAVKFYTEEGNFDLVTLNSPVFPLKDPLFFPSLVNAIGRNPATGLFDPNMFWDFVTHRPEAIFFSLLKFADLGIPDGYRYMPGFSIHTYQVVNASGQSSFVRFFFKSDQGSKYLTSAEAAEIGAKDSDYFTRDLYNAIANGGYPCWTLYVQILSLEDVEQAEFNVFDTTRHLPEDKYPPKPVGRLCFNKNPVNFLAEVEQIALCPTNLVPGILGAPDKIFESRRLAYRDAQYFRLGANFHNIPVNCPVRSFTYNNEGLYNTKQTNAPVYHPNSYNGPVPYVDVNRVELIDIVMDDSLNFDQVAHFYDNQPEDAKERLVGNVVDSLGQADSKLQERALWWFRIIHEGLAQKVEEGLLQDKTKNRTVNPYPDHFVYNFTL